MTDVPEATTLPCGCFINPVIENGVKTLKFSPCRADCPRYRFFLDEAARQDKPVEKRSGG